MIDTAKLSRVKELATQILQRNETETAERRAIREKALADSLRAFEQSCARLEAAERTNEAVTAASETFEDPDLVRAEGDACAEVDAAQETSDAARVALAAARVAVQDLNLQPVALRALLDRLDKGLVLPLAASGVRTMQLRATEAIRAAKAEHPGIFQAECTVRMRSTAVSTAATELSAVRASDVHLRAATEASTLPSVKLAAEKAAAALVRAEQAHSQAQASLVEAEAALRVEMTPVADLAALCACLDELLPLAEAADHVVLQRKAEEDARAAELERAQTLQRHRDAEASWRRQAEQESDERAADPCQCSENYRCGYCYDRQNYPERPDDPTR